MVTQQAEPDVAVEEEEIPAPPEAETPAEPDVSFDESPAEEAAEEQPDPIAEMRREIADLKAQLTQPKEPVRSEAEIAADVERRFQVRRDQQEEQRRRETEDREELHDSIRATLVAAGYSDVEPEAVRKAGERFINKRYDQIAVREAHSVRNALLWLKDNFEQGRSELGLSQKEAGYADQLAQSFNAVMGQMREKAVTGGDYIAKADLPKLVDAEIARRNAKAREQEKPLARVDGTPPAANTNSIEYWERRVAHEGEEGHPDMSAQDWATYKALRRQHGYS